MTDKASQQLAGRQLADLPAHHTANQGGGFEMHAAVNAGITNPLVFDQRQPRRPVAVPMQPSPRATRSIWPAAPV